MPQVDGIRTRPVTADETWRLNDRIRCPGNDAATARARLPVLADGLEWLEQGKDDGWVYFKVVTKAEANRLNDIGDAIRRFHTFENRAITTRLLHDSEPMPSAAPGYEWRVIHHWSDTRNSEIGLYKIDD